MYDIGGTSGIAATLKDRFNTQQGEKALKELKDAAKPLAKLNDVTVGAFNKLTAKKEPVKVEKKEDKPLTEKERADLIEKAAKANAQSIEKAGNEVDDSYTETEKNALLLQYKAGNLTDEDIKKMAAKYEPTIADRLGQVSDAVASGIDKAADFAVDCFNNVCDTMRSEFCAQAPFPQCAACPNRPKNKKKGGGGIPDFMGIIGGAISSLAKGLEDAATALIGCPGLVQGVKTGLLTGDFDGLTNGVKVAGINALKNTALKVGSTTILGAMGGMIPSDTGIAALDNAGEMLRNAGSGQGYDTVVNYMNGALIAGDNLMKVAAYASDGNIQGAYSALTNGSRLSSRYKKHEGRANIGITKTKSGDLVANNESPTLLFSMLSKDAVRSAKALPSPVSTKKIKTRARFSSYKMSTLPGTTISQQALKSAYALDAIRNGTTPPGDVKVRRRKSKRVDVLA